MWEGGGAAVPVMPGGNDDQTQVRVHRCALSGRSRSHVCMNVEQEHRVSWKVGDGEGVLVTFDFFFLELQIKSPLE